MNTSLEFETINENYSTAKYGGFNVLIDMTNGYINAIKLCAYGGKQMKNWLQNNGSKDLIKEFENNLTEYDKVLIKDNIYGITIGTYVHHDLIPHIE